MLTIRPFFPNPSLYYSCIHSTIFSQFFLHQRILFYTLSIKVKDEDDAEFDLLAAAEPEPCLREPTVFLQHDHRHPPGAPDHFKEGIKQGTVAEMVDSRISTFTDMGFTAEQAMEALRRSNNDVNDALTMLLEGRV